MAEKYIVDGYEFDTIEDANIAKKELEAVRVMSQKTEGCSPEVAFKIYNKIVQGNLFKTAIGYDYLRSLEGFLVSSGILGAVDDNFDGYDGYDSGYENTGMHGADVESYKSAEEESEAAPENMVDANSIDFLKTNEKTQKEPEEESAKALKKKLDTTQGRLKTSLFFNILLVVAVVIMMYIASTSSSVNILNYETALQDKYSSWAEELKEKEAGLKEQEKALDEREKKLEELESK